MKVKQQIRDKFRNDVFERDGFKCVMCGRSDVKLDAHHIINRNDPRVKDGGYTLSNGVSLCDDGFSGCHYKAEMGLITEKYLLDLIDRHHIFNIYKNKR